MNFLAHAYLSFNQPPIVVGNMISDFIKGKKKFDYPAEVQKGINFHRAIDTFTDDHPITKEAKQYFKEAVGLYSGAFVDVVFDHYLANDTNQFPNDSLKSFCTNTYNILQENESVLPEKFRLMLPYMIKQNWLYNYRTFGGIELSFGGVTRRAKYLDNSHTAFNSFKENYEQLQKCYNEFFPLLKQFSQQYLEAL